MFFDSNLCVFLAPHQFTSIPFPVKALKIILHDVQSGGEAASMSAQGGVFNVDSDDGVSFMVFSTLYLFSYACFQDDEWSEVPGEQGSRKDDEFAYLSDIIGPKGMAFDNDEVLDSNDDEDLQNDPVSQMDMQVRRSLSRKCIVSVILNSLGYIGPPLQLPA